MTLLERKMIELSNNSQLTRACSNMLELNLSEQQIQQLERWMDHAIKETSNSTSHAVRHTRGY